MLCFPPAVKGDLNFRELNSAKKTLHLNSQLKFVILFNQSQVASFLDRAPEHFLMSVTVAGDTTRKNLSLLRLITPQRVNILKIYMRDSVFAHSAYFYPA